MASFKVLVVSDKLEFQQVFAGALSRAGFVPLIVSSGTEAEAILTLHYIPLVFCSDELENGGINDLIRQTYTLPKRVPLVAVSRFDDRGHRLSLLRDGAFDYVLYPPSDDEIERVTHNAFGTGQFKKAEHTAQ